VRVNAVVRDPGGDGWIGMGCGSQRCDAGTGLWRPPARHAREKERTKRILGAGAAVYSNIRFQI